MPVATTQAQVEELIKTARDAASMQRAWLATKVGTHELMYLGFQYVTAGEVSAFRNTTLGRVWNRTNPDMGQLRVTSNHITEKVQVAAAATYPTALNPTVQPPRRDLGPAAAATSQTMEDLLTSGLKAAGLPAAGQNANINRWISDTYGIILGLKKGERTVNINGQDVPVKTRDLVAKSAHPARFILDPAMDDRDLRMHDLVGHSDVWTGTALRRQFPRAMKGITDDQLKKIGDLTAYEQNMNLLSEGALYGVYRQYSKTPGARIYQFHQKDSSGRFTEMYVGIEIPGGKNEILWANQDDPTSPFGGDGLPMMLLHGHRRPAGVFGIGAVAMMADSQRIVNLTMTMVMRHLQQFVSPKLVVDQRFFGTNATAEQIRSEWTNAVGGLIIGKPMSQDKSIRPPELMPAPAYSNQITEIAREQVNKMRQDSGRSEQAAGGGVKSHVADSTYERSLQEGDRVMGIIRTEDCRAYEKLLEVVLGTEVKHVQEQSASTLARLDRDGFDVQDITTILNTDAAYPTCGITLAEGDLVFVSDAEKRAKLDAAITAQAITAEYYQRAMAELDQALSPEDKFNLQEINKAVATFVTSGQPWTPMPMGPYGQWVLSALRRARFDKRVKFQPQFVAMVDQAIAMQTQFNVQEQIQSNPELVMQREQMQMDAQMQAAKEQEAAAAAESEEQAQQPQTLADLLATAA